MSAQEGIAVIAITAMLLCSFSNAENYTVGGSGWGFGMNGWPHGQTFMAGDVLEFKYNPAFHNVVIVNKENYDSCTASGTRLNSGHDNVTLTSGTSYYICGFPGHCLRGVKAVVITL